MNLDQITDAPDILMEFLEYHSTVRGHSDQTVAGYYLDLKILFRFCYQSDPGFPQHNRLQQSLVCCFYGYSCSTGNTAKRDPRHYTVHAEEIRTHGRVRSCL